MTQGVTERLEGADLIKSCVLLIADQLCVHLGRVEWIEDLLREIDRYTLRIEAMTDTGSLPIEMAQTELNFTHDSLIGFRSTTTEVTESQIRPHLIRLSKRLANKWVVNE